jgi:hypothetical protein
VHDHGEGLDERCIADVDARRERHERSGGHPHLVGHATVATDSEEHGTAGATEVVLAVEAWTTGAARCKRLDCDGCSVIGEAGDLVPERDRGSLDDPGIDQVQVGSADAGRTHSHPHPGLVTRRDIVDGHLAAVNANGTHVSSHP